MSEKRQLTPEMKAYFAELGRKGGQSKSPAKTKAGRKNVRKAQAALHKLFPK